MQKMFVAIFFFLMFAFLPSTQAQDVSFDLNKGRDVGLNPFIHSMTLDSDETYTKVIERVRNNPSLKQIIMWIKEEGDEVFFINIELRRKIWLQGVKCRLHIGFSNMFYSIDIGVPDEQVISFLLRGEPCD